MVCKCSQGERAAPLTLCGIRPPPPRLNFPYLRFSKTRICFSADAPYPGVWRFELSWWRCLCECGLPDAGVLGGPAGLRLCVAPADGRLAVPGRGWVQCSSHLGNVSQGLGNASLQKNRSCLLYSNSEKLLRNTKGEG